MTQAERAQRLGAYLPAVVLITDSARLRGRAMVDVVGDAVEGGVNIVQVREKHLATAELTELAASVRARIGDRALLFVNGDVDAALASGADGVHLPERGMSVVTARARAGDLLVSRAVHSLQAAMNAQGRGADLVQVGTVFPTASKPEGRVAGLDLVFTVAARMRIPVIAVGGITPANASTVLSAGAAGVAVIGAIMDAASPRDAAAVLRAAVTPHAATV
jgi:thiamine-phosphate pyrophosphorylase